jgi:hypothetical protein
MIEEEEEEIDIDEMAWTVVEQKSNDIRAFGEEFKRLNLSEMVKLIRSVYPKEEDSTIKQVAKRCMEWAKKGHAEDPNEDDLSTDGDLDDDEDPDAEDDEDDEEEIEEDE